MNVENDMNGSFLNNTTFVKSAHAVKKMHVAQNYDNDISGKIRGCRFFMNPKSIVF